MHKTTTRVALLLLCLTACVAHEKNGDRAAAVGDWKTAQAAYREALMSEPESPALKEKYERARQEAVAAAAQRARTCASARDWQCVLAEADFVLGLDASHTELATLRADAAREMGSEQLQRAREAAANGQYAEALGFLKRATTVSGDGRLLEESAQVREEVLTRTEAEAERLWQQGEYPRALALLRLVASTDPARREKLEAAEAEYARYQEAEYERLAREGDGALAERRWADAQARYEEALRVKAGGRAEPLLAYAEGLARGDSALAQGDAAAAVAGYRQAVESGMDREGYAAERLAQAEQAARTRSYWLTGGRAVVRAGDYEDEGGDGPPDLYVEVEQAGRIVYRGPWVENEFTATWAPSEVHLDVEDGELLVVRLWDADEAGGDVVLAAFLSSEALAAGHFQAGTQGGSTLELRFAPRRPVGPPSASTSG
ncbi:MAG TPA: hypothetical protein VLQ93_24705, partial [Myxococcaceae bacterium]|nr:hypothetical protein [Myxococcaceae bacterium]